MADLVLLDDVPVHLGPLPEAQFGEHLENSARARVSAAQEFLNKVCDLAGVAPVALGGYARRGAYFDYRTRKTYISRQLLALGSPRLIGFILAHEIGHATQRLAKRKVLAWEQQGTAAFAIWVLVAWLPQAPAWASSPWGFYALLGAFAVALKAADIWWEIDADKKARQWTGYSGSLGIIFDEFLSVEATSRTNWQGSVRILAARWLWPSSGLKA